MGSVVVNAALPIFALIFLGAVLRRVGFPGAGFWAPAERLVYWLLFPALLIVTLAGAEFEHIAALPIAFITAGSILLMSGVTWGLKHALRTAGPAFTSVFQGSVRLNSYIGFSIVGALHGVAGMAAAAVVVATFVPLVNVIGIGFLSAYGDDKRPSPGSVVLELLRNPLIIACGIGLGLNLGQITIVPAVDNLLDLMARACLPLGLLTVGAALNFGAARESALLIAITSALKLIALPAIALLGVYWFSLDGVSAFVTLVFLALPTSPSAYLLARQLGGDANLMANLVSAQTLASIATLPLLIAVLL